MEETQSKPKNFSSETVIHAVAPIGCLRVLNSTIVGGLTDGSIQIWDADSRKLLLLLKGHGASVVSLDFNEKAVFSVSEDRELHVWNMKTGKILETLKVNDCPCELKLSKSLLVCSLSSGDVTVWKVSRVNRTTQVRTLKTSHQSPVAVSETYIITTTPESPTEIAVWNSKCGKLERTLRGHEDKVASLDLKDSTVVSGSWDHSVRIWNVQSEHCLKVVGVHNSWVRRVLIHGNHQIISAGGYNDVRVWDMVKALSTEQSNSSACMKTLKCKFFWTGSCIQVDNCRLFAGDHREISIFRCYI